MNCPDHGPQSSQTDDGCCKWIVELAPRAVTYKTDENGNIIEASRHVERRRCGKKLS